MIPLIFICVAQAFGIFGNTILITGKYKENDSCGDTQNADYRAENRPKKSVFIPAYIVALVHSAIFGAALALLVCMAVK